MLEAISIDCLTHVGHHWQKGYDIIPRMARLK